MSLRELLREHFGFGALWRPIQLADLAAARAYMAGQLLDVGCGGKPYAPLCRTACRRYVGLDWPASPQAPRADVYGSAMRLPFRDASFDAALCTQVLEHVPEPPAVLAEIARVLIPGGHLIASAPMMNALHEEPHDYLRFTSHGLRYALLAAGFDPVLIKPQGGFWLMIGQQLGSHFAYRLSTWPRVPGLVYLLGASLTLFRLLDRLDYAPGYTMNWFVVARRLPAGGRSHDDRRAPAAAWSAPDRAGATALATLPCASRSS